MYHSIALTSLPSPDFCSLRNFDKTITKRVIIAARHFAAVSFSAPSQGSYFSREKSAQDQLNFYEN